MKQSLPLIRHFPPMPLFLYGTYREDGAPNFGLFSWLSYYLDGEVGVMACIAGEKLTKDRIRATGIFSANLVTEGMLPVADYLGCTPGYDEGKMRIELAVERGRVLDVPILTQSPWSYELEVDKTIETNGGTVFLCKVRNVLADEAIAGEPDDAAAWMDLMRPMRSVRQTYLNWDGTAAGTFGGPMQTLK